MGGQALQQLECQERTSHRFFTKKSALNEGFRLDVVFSAFFIKLFGLAYPECLEGNLESPRHQRTKFGGKGEHEIPCLFLWLNSCPSWHHSPPGQQKGKLIFLILKLLKVEI